jgi:hypothetical protein
MQNEKTTKIKNAEKETTAKKNNIERKIMESVFNTSSTQAIDV